MHALMTIGMDLLLIIRAQKTIFLKTLIYKHCLVYIPRKGMALLFTVLETRLTGLAAFILELVAEEVKFYLLV